MSNTDTRLVFRKAFFPWIQEHVIFPVIAQARKDFSVAVTKHTESFALSNEDNELLYGALLSIVDPIKTLAEGYSWIDILFPGLRYLGSYFVNLWQADKVINI